MRTHLLAFAFVATAASLSACSGTTPLGPSKSSVEAGAAVAEADVAVRTAQFDHAERVLAGYVHRTKDGRLKLNTLGLSGENKKRAIDTIVLLLWETGRDETLAAFAADYLPSYERQITLCRLAERQARYQDAYTCWNDLGHTDRADRVIRVDSAIRILVD